MAKKLHRRNRELQRQEEENKQQLLHAETIGMMIKYQFVYIKIENTFQALERMFQSKVHLNMFHFLSCLQALRHGHSLHLLAHRYRTKRAALEGLHRIAELLSRKTQGYAAHLIARLRIYNSIHCQPYYQHSLREMQNTQEHSLKVLSLDLRTLQHDLRGLENKQKQKKTGFELDKRVYSLQENRADQVLLNQIHSLESTNHSLSQRQATEEEYIAQFVQQMNELLDHHEMATAVSQQQQHSQIQHLQTFQSRLKNKTRH